MSRETIRAGVAHGDITPPPGIRLSGFAGRPSGGNIGVDDPLRASALYLEQGGVSAVLVTLDIIGLSPRDDALFRRAVGSAAGVSPERVLIACSHTHAGPATMKIRATGERERDWTIVIRERAADAAMRARASAAPVSLPRIGEAPCDAAINRRAHGGPRDPTCRTLLLESAPGRPLALLFHYGMHPVALGRTMRVSPDWVGAARREIESALSCPALFLSGCCGDINPRCGVSDDRAIAARNASEMGREVARAALQAVAASSEASASRPGASVAVARIPLRPLPDDDRLVAVCRAADALLNRPETALAVRHLARADLQWAQACRRTRNPRPYIAARVSSLRIGPLSLVGLPGEIFTEIGQRIRAATPHAWPVAYANGNLGYLYPDAALSEGGYEVDIAYRLYGTRQADHGTADALVDAGIRVAV